jgi:hypothetical protein
MSYLCKLFNFRRKWMKCKNIIKLRLPEIQLFAVVPTQLKFSIVKDYDEPTILLFETLYCIWECFNMGTELPTKVILEQTLVLMQITLLNNVRKVGRLVLPRTSCYNRKTRLKSSWIFPSFTRSEIINLCKFIVELLASKINLLINKLVTLTVKFVLQVSMILLKYY